MALTSGLLSGKGSASRTGERISNCGQWISDAARGLWLGDCLTLNRQDGFGQQPFERRKRFGRVDDHLDRAAHVAQHEEVDAAQPAQCVQPPCQPDVLSDVRTDFRCVDTFHLGTPELNKIRAPVCQGRFPRLNEALARGEARSRCHPGSPEPHDPGLTGQP